MALDKLISIGAPLGVFSSGAREVEPEGAAETIVGLIGDDGMPFKRGGSSYKSNAALGAAGLLGLWTGSLPVGTRTLLSSTSAVAFLGSDDATPTTLLSGTPNELLRMVQVGPLVAIPYGKAPLDTVAYLWGGALQNKPTYSTGVATVEEGFTTVTGVGTAFLANVEPGMLFRADVFNVIPIAQVVDDTTLILAAPWATESLFAVGYSIDSAVPLQQFGADDVTGLAPVMLANVANRLAFSSAERPFDVRFTRAVTVGRVEDTDYHTLPARVCGLAALRDALVVFTEGGAYSIANMGYELVDAAGGPQQSLGIANGELVAWGHEGIASWAGALIVPALDNVWLMDSISAPVPLASDILDLYLSYVSAGYRPGVATAYRSHYVLPILDGSNNWVDTLVCRTRPPRGGDRAAWSTLAGDGAQVAALSYRADPPKLLAASRKTGSRVLDVTKWFEPAAAVKNDAEGTTPAFQYTTRAFSTGNMVPNFVSRVRARYVLTDAASDNPTVTCEASIDGGSWTTLTRSDGSGTTSPESDGSSAYSWAVRQKCRDVRFRFTVAGPSASCRFETVEVFIRHSGRY